MKEEHRSIRTQISVMCRERAVSYINGFHLLEDEQAYIIEHEVEDKSLQEIADNHHVNYETVKRRRHDAFQKIADAIKFRNEQK